MPSTTSSAEPGFAWVLASPDSKGYRPSKADRLAIRRHAMKTVTAGWRQRGDYGRINMGQYPVFASNNNAIPIEAVEQQNAAIWDSPVPGRDQIRNLSGATIPGTPWHQPSVPASMPLSKIEQLRAVFSIDILSLSMLTVTHVGQVVSLFSSHPSRLVSLLHQQKTSYLSHIPNRIGHSPCLDHAICALLSKARDVFNPSSPVNKTLMLSEHGKALQTLQEAINDPVHRTQPDVLCATELLGIIEVLNLSQDNAWAQHVSGASYLLQSRGPKEFRSDYEMDLFASLLGPIICEALRKNEACFLEQQVWQEALDSIVIPGDRGIFDRSVVSISLRKSVARLPSLFKSVAGAVCHSNSTSRNTVQHLISQIRRLHNDLLQHLTQLRCLYLHPGPGALPSTKTDIYYEVLGTNLIALIMANRLLGAVGDAQAESLEHDALLYASEIKTLEEEMSSTHGWASFYLNQKALLAASIPATTEIWEVAPGEIIENWRFNSWCRAMQRQTCCDSTLAG